MFISVVHFAMVSIYVDNRMDIKTSRLILKQDGCGLVREYGISIQPHSNNECQITVPYETNMFGTHGKIHINDQEIRLAEDQVIVVGTLDEHEWTQEKRWLVGWLGMSVALMAVLLALMALRSHRKAPPSITYEKESDW